MNEMILGIILCSIYHEIITLPDQISNRTARQTYINNVKYLLEALAPSGIVVTSMVNKGNEIPSELAE